MSFKSLRTKSLRTKFLRTLIAGAALLALTPEGTSAAEHVVKMLNKDDAGEFMVFDPPFVQAEVGDTVKFVATDPFHNAETMPEILPDGATPFRGELSKDVTLTIEKPGVYGVKCLPHYPMGMIALVVAGEPVNADQLKSYEPATPQLKKRYDALVEQVPN